MYIKSIFKYCLHLLSKFRPLEALNAIQKS